VIKQWREHIGSQMHGAIIVIAKSVNIARAMSVGRQFPLLGLRRHLFLAGAVALTHG